jgi:hypothetical protein
MRHSGVCEGCWIIKRSRLALGARGAGTHASPSKTFTTHVTVMTRYRVRILYQPPSHYSPRTPVTATDPVISVPRSCGAGCTPVRLPPFACLGLAHVLRAEPQISLRRTGRCPAWDRVDRGGDVACSPARPRSDDNVQYCDHGCIFEILLLDIGDRMGITKLNTSDTARRARTQVER